MKRYRKLLLQIGILLFAVGLIVFVVEQRKQFFTVDFSRYYEKNKTIELSSFEDGDLWQGNFSFDSQRVSEGRSSITLSSWYGKENTIRDIQTTSLYPGYTNGYISLYIADKKNLSSLVSLSLELLGEAGQKKEFTLTPHAKVGWNRIAVPMPNWKKITQKSFTIISKPDAIAEVNLDRFWIENTSSYTADVLTTQSKALSLRTIGDRTYLFSSSPVSQTYGFTTPSNLGRGYVVLSLLPEHGKQVSLSLNGTSVKIGGDSHTLCQLYKGAHMDKEQTLKIASGKDNLYVFIRADVGWGRVTYSVSNNGVDFESCGFVTSSQTTPIQLSLEGSYLIDSFSVEY